eukprot:896872-Amphidinium_carterae.1
MALGTVLTIQKDVWGIFYVTLFVGVLLGPGLGELWFCDFNRLCGEVIEREGNAANTFYLVLCGCLLASTLEVLEVASGIQKSCVITWPKLVSRIYSRP